MDPAELIQRYAGRLTYTEQQPEREAVVEPWPDWVSASIRRALAARGVTHLWAHQREALDLVNSGQHTIVTTGTASGKSLTFQVPALAAIESGRENHRMPSVLYLAPTKALAADQLRRIRELDPQVRAATVDGDNSREERQWARDHAAWVLTNPDTLHHVILPGHQRWSRLLRGLRLIVVDECHHYRGVFGAHVALVLRRLLRLCEQAGSAPVVVCSSATLAEPAVFAKRLTGLDAAAVTEDASPRGPRTIALWEPALLNPDDPQGARRPAAHEAADLVADLAHAEVQSVCFVRSRRGAEYVTSRAQLRLGEIDPQLRGRIATYRGGYLPEERRELESRLRSGDVLALTSTSALELGIDISGLDAVLTVGWPGTRASLLQQWGRAGRGATRSSLGVLIASPNPIDTYLIHHPEAILSAPIEATVFDTDNPHVLGPHLAAAAQELPLTDADFARFGPRAQEGVEALTAAGWLRERSTGWYWTRRERASDLADLRGTSGRPVQIVDEQTGRLIGTVDASTADSTVHSGAVYVHQGEIYLVDEYSPEDALAVVRAEDPGWTTQARSSTRVDIIARERSMSWGDATIATGTVDVTSQVTSYVRYRAEGGGPMGEEQLDLPERTLRTKAVWWTVTPQRVSECLDAADVPGAAHAAEHASIGLLPLLATCDRWDLGGLSTAVHADTGMLTVFVHDGHPGGAGFATHGYEVAQTWLRFTRDTIASCPCSQGCPACVQSPKCGNGNDPLDKAGAVRLLDAVLADAQNPTDQADDDADRTHGDDHESR